MEKRARASKSPGRLALIASLALAGCKATAPDEPPPHATDSIEMPAQSSLIALPVTANTRDLATALERAVPQQLWSINQPGMVCVPSRKVKVLFVRIKTPTLKCDLVGTVTRGPLAVTGRGSDIVVTLPVRAVFHARDIGGILKQETATAAATVRAVAKLSLNPDWSPRGTVNIEYDWTTPPGVDFLGHRIMLTDKADPKLQAVIARLEQTLPNELAKLGVRKAVEQVWAQGFTSLQLNRENPPVWMRLTPQELQFGGYSVTSSTLSLNLGLKAQTETFVGPRPADPPRTPLPAVRKLDEKVGRLNFYIPVVADYAQLEPVIHNALVKRSARPFDVPGVGPLVARFEKVTAYGTDNNRIAVGIAFAAMSSDGATQQARGTIWLTGLPVNAENSERVTFQDVKVSGATDRKGANLLIKLANTPAFSQTVADSLAQNFTNDYNKLIGQINRAIDVRREGDLLIQARVDSTRIGTLKAAGKALYLPVWGSGSAAIRVAPK